MKPPTSDAEFVDNYYSMVYRVLLFKYHVRRDEVKEMTQQFVFEWIVGGYTNIYDPTKGVAFETFLLSFVYTRVMRERTRKKYNPLVNASVIVGDFDEDERQGIILAGDAEDATQSIIKSELGERIKEQVQYCREVLREIPSKGSSMDDCGMEYERSLLTVFDMLMMGCKRKQIQQSLSYSKASISLMITELRKMPCIKYLKELLMERSFYATNACRV